jgi:rhodanese-related sulfurtransferase
MWRERREVALFDAREEGPFSLEHPFFAVPMPLSRIELSMRALAPRLDTPVVFYDDGEGLAENAAARVAALGYRDVRLLAGGLAAYRAEGEVFRDVNVPSKAFGELVEAVRGTPSLSAREVKRLIDERADMVVLDGRRFEEYRAMSLPTAISVPNGELALRVRALAPRAETLVVVNCAGRTRSIIGAQTLVNAGIPNRVAALRNGTIGWTLEGFALEHGAGRKFEESFEGREAARASAAVWAARAGVKVLSELPADRTIYRFDVRTPEEFAAGHPEGFVSAPGGQLVQATDEWVAVRGALIVLFDDDGVRARMTGSWLAQMGWDVAVVEGLPLVKSAARASAPGTTSEIRDSVVVDLASSPVYARGHIPGAWFMVRSRFALDCGQLPAGRIVVTSPDGWLAHYAAADLARACGQPVEVLIGGTAGYRGELECECRWASPAIDVYKRPYEGTDNSAQAMRAYLEWEFGLVAQVANDGIANFRVIR